jgi:hypothetical protein
MARSLTDEPAFVAQPGEEYRVGLIEEGWALVERLGDVPSLQCWIASDQRVRFSALGPG